MPKAKAESLNIGYYLTLASRRRWYIIIPFYLSMIVGIVLAVKLPRIYEASTMILVQPQRVPEKIVMSVIGSDLYSRITTLSQQILSRSNLETIINKLKLFGEQESGDLLDEEKVDSIRQRIKVDVTRSRDRIDTNSFTISFRDRDPLTAMQVANGLADNFIEENLKAREDQAVGTTDFLDSELVTMRKRLEEVETILRDFRVNHKGMLPDELESNLRILDRLNNQLAGKEDYLRSTRTSLLAIETDAAARVNEIKVSKEDEERNPGKLREKLAEMVLKYTDQHPDIIRMKAAIEKLESELAAKPETNKTPSLTTKLDPSSAGGDAGNLFIRQRIELSGTIKGLEADIAKLKQNIAVYEERVEETSKYGQELYNLQRDYENMRNSYNSLLNRKLEAEIAVNMERKQKGEQFMIIDVARIPEKPVSPKLPKLFMISIAAGLGLGAVLIFLVEMTDVSVRRLDKLEEEIGLPVLTLVPRIFTSKDRRQDRLVFAATTVSIVVALALAGAFAMMSLHGVEPTLELFGFNVGA